jgi:hypothetical protein
MVTGNERTRNEEPEIRRKKSDDRKKSGARNPNPEVAVAAFGFVLQNGMGIMAWRY